VNHHEENVNVRAAIIHIIGDIVQSVGVVIAAIIIYIKPSLVIADPICTFIFSVIVFFTTVDITKRCVSILMEACPEHINIQDLEDLLYKDLKPQLISIYDLKVWSLSSGKNFCCFCAIVTITDNSLLNKMISMIKRKFKFESVIIQIETNEERDLRKNK